MFIFADMILSMLVRTKFTAFIIVVVRDPHRPIRALKVKHYNENTLRQS